MALGQILKSAREAKGLTASQLAEATHIFVKAIEGLENEEFEDIPAAIYGRGFIKLYCEQVGIADYQPLQKEFTDLYTGKIPRQQPPPMMVKPPAAPAVPPASDRAAAPQPPAAPLPEPPPIAHPAPGRTIAPPPPAAPLSEPPPAAPAAPQTPAATTQPPSVRGLDLFDAAHRPAQPPATVNAPRRDNPFAVGYDRGEESPSPLDKFQSALSSVSHGVLTNVRRLPTNTGRYAVAGLFALVLLFFIGWGVAALYKATALPPPAAGEKAERAKSAETAKPEAPGPSTPAAAAKPPAETPKPPVAKPVAAPGKLHASGTKVPAIFVTDK